MTTPNTKVVRCVFVGATQHDITPVDENLRDWIVKTMIERFDSVTGKESWFYLFNPTHMRGLIARSESILQGSWDGPGWYHTSLRRVRGTKWLTAEKGNIFEAFRRRFAMSAADRERFEVFVARLKKS